MSCVASVGGVSVEAEARMGHGRKPRSPDTCQIKPTDRHQALAADFFDSIGQTRKTGPTRAKSDLLPGADMKPVETDFQ